MRTVLSASLFTLFLAGALFAFSTPQEANAQCCGAVDEVEGAEPASAIDPGNEDTEPAEDEPVEAATE